MADRPGLIRRANHWRLNKCRKLRNAVLLKWYELAYAKRRPHYPISELPKCHSLILMMLRTGIGDAIVMSGFINALRQSGREVHCICNSRTAVILSEMIDTDGVYVLPNRPSRKDVLKLNLACDGIIMFLDPEKRLLEDIKVITAIKHRFAIGFNQKLSVFFDLNIIRDEIGCHWTERLKDGAKQLGVVIDDYKYDLHFSPDCLRDVDEFVKKLGPQGFVLFNPIASDKFRSLSPEVVRSTIDHLTHHSTHRIVVFNVTDATLRRDYPQVIFTPFAELDRCLALVGRCACLITVDTSFVHAARFFDVPMIGIYNNRLSFGRYDNNVQWGPGYAKALQVFSLDHDQTETGDDLRRLPFEVLKQAMEQYSAVR